MTAPFQRADAPVGPVIRLWGSYSRWCDAASQDGGAAVSVRGNAWMDGHLLTAQDLAERIVGVAGSGPRRQRLEALLVLSRQLDGAWAFCVRWADGEALAAVDRLRMMPLFYGHLGDGRLAISDLSASLADCTGGSTLDGEAAVEFLLAGYVMDSRTLHEGVSQIQPGEALLWRDGAVSLHRHYRFLRARSSTEGPESLTKTLHATMDEVFARLVQQFAGQRVIVPLSGGLDSRLVVAMLKRHGHRDLVALNYGRAGSPESETSRAVADALQVPWIFIPYEDGGWHELVSAPAMKEFWLQAGQAASLPHLQDSLALHELRRQDPGLQAVFLPGYVGDMIAGAWTASPELFRSLGLGRQSRTVRASDGPVDLKAVYRWLLLTKYNLWPAGKGEIGAIEERIRSFFSAVPFTEAHNSATAFDLFEFENRQARYIANSVRSFEYYGFGWWLPLCDSSLMDFFLSVPTDLRNVKRLYATWMRSHIFVKRMALLADIPPIGDGRHVWYERQSNLRRASALQQGREVLAAIYRATEPPFVRKYRLGMKQQRVGPSALRFEEWFAADEAGARSTRLRDLMTSRDGSFSRLPPNLSNRFRALQEDPLRFVAPLGLLAAAYLAEEYGRDPHASFLELSRGAQPRVVPAFRRPPGSGDSETQG